MALVTINGRDVFEAHISIPRVGIWHVDALIDLGTTIADGKVSMRFHDGATLKATVARQAVFANYLRLRAVAGAGVLYKTKVDPKQWCSGPIPVSVPLKYILGLAGESLSHTTDQGLLNSQLVSWTCLPQSCPAAIRSLILNRAEAWRMLDDGSFWAGNESWPVVDKRSTYTVERARTDIGVMEVAEDSSSLRPGTTFQGFRISRVDNYINQREFKTLVHYFDAPT